MVSLKTVGTVVEHYAKNGGMVKKTLTEGGVKLEGFKPNGDLIKTVTKENAVFCPRYRDGSRTLHGITGTGEQAVKTIIRDPNASYIATHIKFAKSKLTQLLDKGANLIKNIKTV